MSPDSNPSASAPIVIIGAGPVGLALALGLARHGTRSIVLEKKPTTSRTSKAPGLHVRTREILRQWGVEDRFLEAGSLWQPVTMHSVVRGRRPLVSLDFSEIADEADRPGLLILEQNEVERLLLESVRASGLADVRFEAEAVGLEQDARAARVRYRHDGTEDTLEARFVVGCDGAGSFVRQALGLPFDGMTYSLRPVLADIEIDDERDGLPQPRAWTGRGGYAFAARLRPGLWRLVHLAQGAPEKEEVSPEEVAGLVGWLLGPGPFRFLWGNRFRIHVRASPRFRVGRVFLAGDAAHVHSPASGFGMNGGIQDAHNLAWKLAYSLDGGATADLLDSYDEERRAVVVETTSRYTDRVTRLFIDSPAAVRQAAFAGLRLLLRSGRFRRRALRRMTMTDLDYPPSALLRRRDRAAGLRLPNPLLRAPDGRAVRLYDLLPNSPVILDVAEGRDFAADLPLDQVIRIGPGGYEEPTGSLRGILRRRDGWILVRPDAYIAWARHRRGGMERAVLRALGRTALSGAVPGERAAVRGPRPRRAAAPTPPGGF